MKIFVCAIVERMMTMSRQHFTTPHTNAFWKICLKASKRITQFNFVFFTTVTKQNETKQRENGFFRGLCNWDSTHTFLYWPIKSYVSPADREIRHIHARNKLIWFYFCMFLMTTRNCQFLNRVFGWFMFMIHVHCVLWYDEYNNNSIKRRIKNHKSNDWILLQRARETVSER